MSGYPAKRLLDLALAAPGLVLLSPLFLACCLAVRLDSKGPAVFRQTRVGAGQKPFTCLKLRTMFLDTPEGASHTIRASAVTRVGRMLRRTKLDEIPQLINVLRGELSLVGPRPCLPSQAELIAAREARGVFAARPGITGLAQIAGIDMSDPQRLANVDAEYVRTASMRLDLWILLMTVFGRGRGDRTAA
jgi:lipopolysaccharide/colanic/teichoic acid biosynthesis glycosyltransferase